MSSNKEQNKLVCTCGGGAVNILCSIISIVYAADRPTTALLPSLTPHETGHA